MFDKLFKMRICSVCIVVILLNSCSANEKQGISDLSDKYGKSSADSMKFLAARFLITEMPYQHSDKLIFRKISNGRIVNLNLSTFTTTKDLIEATKKQNLEPEELRVNDLDILKSDFLEQEIDAATELYNKYPWNKGVPKEIFLEYLLPYKIHQEYPDNWRRTLRQRVDSVIKKWEADYSRSPNDPKFTSGKEFYYDLIVNTASRWFGYGPDSVILNDEPSFSLLLLMKKGECKPGSFFNAYVLRSAGVPSTVDVVPFWGSKNGSHVTEVYWNNAEKKMTPGPGRYLERPAKVIRLTFKRHQNWSKFIKPYVNENDFLLSYLQNDYWLNATQEHTITSDIRISLNENKKKIKFGYVCVYDYGQWQPVFWGVFLNDNLTFKNMGRNVLYRVAIPTELGLDYAGRVFLLDSSGKIRYFEPDYNKKQTMKLGKLNTGAEMWVKKNKVYSLYFMNSENNWNKISELRCTRDSVMEFKGVPSNALYRLIDNSGKGKLERIFSYELGRQIWY